MAKSNWLLLFINILFVALGIFLMFFSKDDKGFKVGLMSSSFFGFGLFVFAYTTYLNYKTKKQLDEKINDINISPDRKIFVDKSKIYFLSFVFILLSFILFYTYQDSIQQILFSILFLILGIYFLLGTFFKFIQTDFIQIGYDGIQKGNRKFSYLIRWDNIQSYSIGEYHSNPAIFIRLLNPEDCSRYLYSNKGNREKNVHKLYNQILNNLTYASSHILILPDRHGLSAAYLYKVIDKYTRIPETRIELKRSQVKDA
jgi:hypothetical protein